MVKIPIGNGSKNVTLMVVFAHTRRGKEANARNEHIFDAGLGRTEVMICGDLQHEPRRQSRHTDFALSQVAHGPETDAQTCWSSPTLHTCKQGDTKTRLDFAPVNEAFRGTVGDVEVVQRNLVPKHKGLKITLTLDTNEQKVWMMRQPTTLNAEDKQLLELTFRRKWKQVNQQAIMEARNRNHRRRKSDAMSKA